MRLVLLTIFLSTAVCAAAIAETQQGPDEIFPPSQSGVDAAGFQPLDPTVTLPNVLPDENAPQSDELVYHVGDATKLTSALISERDFSQIFLVQGGTYTPQAITISNGDYKFNYDQDALDSYVVQVGFGLRVLNFLGGWHLVENLGYSSFSGSALSSIRGNQQQEDLKLNLMSLDTRLMYSLEWFPWKAFIPFAEGGYQYSFYSQTGPTDLESVQGGIGNFDAGAGFRLWLNYGKFTGEDFTAKFATIPIFLTAKVNWIFPGGQDIDLSARTYIAGIAVAL